MPNITKYYFLASAVVASFASPVYAINDMVAAVEPYVYPANKPKTAAEMTYMPDGLSYLTLSADGKTISRYGTEKGELIETILDVAKTRNTKISDIEGFTLSDNGEKILVYTDSEPIYRHSFKAKYYVFEIKRNILKPLSAKFERQQAPAFSPDGRMVVFSAENNLYIKKLDYDNEVAVTTDGKVNSIINGVPDWTYQEEFATESSITWSPDNTALCYIKYDETEVPVYSFPLYEGACKPNVDYSLYPGNFSYKYPVAGQQNSAVSVYCYNIENRTTKKVAVPAANMEYIPRISYAFSPERLMVVTLNRAQNKMEIFAANPKSTVAHPILTETSDSWISPATYEQISWQPDGFVMQSPRSGYNHLYLYAYNGIRQRQLTTGQWNVTNYYGKDKSGNHYFQSTATGALNRVVSKVDSKGKVTNLSKTSGTSSAEFSPEMSYFSLTYSDVTTPPSQTLYNLKNKQLRVLESNDSLKSIAETLPTKEFFTFQSDGYELNGYMIKPVGFNSTKKYPVIMWQYSGPGSQQVLNKWQVDWEIAAAKEGFAVVCVDGRGTGGRDRAFEVSVYKNLGKFETIDQVNAAHYIAQLPWVNGERIGMAGWSYGGYETLMCASSGHYNPFAAAVAIAPVTDWRYYDTVYAERYMLTPNENQNGYDESTPINHISDMDCRLLIMSGTADDNVHLSNTMEYVSRLISAKKTCDMMLFPNMNHSINQCGSRAVVYGKMLDYFKQTLQR